MDTSTEAHTDTKINNVDKKKVSEVVLFYSVVDSTVYQDNRRKKAGREAEGTQGLISKNCTSRESVSPLLRLIRSFRHKYH